VFRIIDCTSQRLTIHRMQHAFSPPPLERGGLQADLQASDLASCTSLACGATMLRVMQEGVDVWRLDMQAPHLVPPSTAWSTRTPVR
jgi:hypothetical protein